MPPRAKWQERKAIPPLPGPASCCFHCEPPARAICLASTKPVCRSGPHGASGSLTAHLTHSLSRFVFIFLHRASPYPSILTSLSPSLSLLAGSCLKSDPVAVYPEQGCVFSAGPPRWHAANDVIWEPLYACFCKCVCVCVRSIHLSPRGSGSVSQSLQSRR